MKKIYYLITLLLFISIASSAQVRIGNATAAPHEGAILDLKSEETATKGLMLPNVNLNDVNTFQLAGSATDGVGMMVFNTNASINDGNGIGVYAWDGSKWSKVNRGREEPIDPNLPGTPGDWVTSNSSGDGTYESPYINTCPVTTVELTVKSGYVFGHVIPDDVATLSGDKLTFSKTGTVVITNGTQRATVFVMINDCEILVGGITISGPESIVIGGAKMKMSNSIEPSNATNKNIKWTTSNDQIASIDETTGELTASKIGSVIITAESLDGSNVTSNSIEVFVTDQSIIEKIGNNYYGTYKYGDDTWMVWESEEGDASYIYPATSGYNQSVSYYNESVKSDACPSGWVLPDFEQVQSLYNRLMSQEATDLEKQWWIQGNNLGNGYVSNNELNSWGFYLAINEPLKYARIWSINGVIRLSAKADTGVPVRCVKIKLVTRNHYFVSFRLCSCWKQDYINEHCFAD